MTFQHSLCLFYYNHLVCINLLVATNSNLRVYQLCFAFDLFLFLRSNSRVVKKKFYIFNTIIFIFVTENFFPKTNIFKQLGLLVILEISISGSNRQSALKKESKPYFVFLFTTSDFVISKVILSLTTSMVTFVFVATGTDKYLKIDLAF